MKKIHKIKEIIIYSVSISVVVAVLVFLAVTGVFSTEDISEKYSESFYIVGRYSDDFSENKGIAKAVSAELENIGLDLKKSATLFLKSEDEEYKAGKAVKCFTGIHISSSDYDRKKDILEKLKLEYVFLPRKKCLFVTTSFVNAISILSSVLKYYPRLNQEARVAGYTIEDYCEIYCSYDRTFEILVFVSK